MPSHKQANRQEPTLWQKRRLIQDILTCESIRRYTSRARILADLSELQPQLADKIPPSERPRDDVTNIVNTCLKYPYAFESFIDALHAAEGSSHAMQRLAKTLRNIFPLLIDWIQLAELKSLLLNIDLGADALREICRACVPEFLPLPAKFECTDREALDCLLSWLIDAGRLKNGSPPVPFFAFVQRLSQHLEEPERVQEWLQRIADIEDLPPPEIKTDVSSPGSSAALYLIIELTPLEKAAKHCGQTGKNSEPGEKVKYHCLVQAWLAQSGSGQMRQICAENDRDLEEMPALLHELLRRIDEELSKAGNLLTVEFCLPVGLLCYPVEHWDIFGEDTPIGFQYKVVVRSQERIRGEIRNAPWRQHWNAELLEKEETKQHIVWLDKPDSQAAAFCLRHPKVICAALAFQPEANKDHGQNILLSAIKHGVPIILWSRQADDPVKADMKNLLDDAALAQLPESLQRKRQDAWGKKTEHTSDCHLSLLWDDPNRIPPEPAYAAPEKQQTAAVVNLHGIP
ncbi:MAG: hypothetical protein GY862_31760 [Gammaproteobacteria bacterium]|nr:hypothetical protein [Gammaproteobacteria bacterium]